MRKWRVRLGIPLLLITAYLLLRATLWAPQPVPVLIHQVSVGRVEETITNSRAGSVRARRRARLSPETGGQVVAIPFREGERVQAGDILLKLEASGQQAAVSLAQRELEAVTAERERACLGAERAERELGRMQRLAADEIVSTDLLDSIESAQQAAAAACRAAGAHVGRAAASVTVAETELNKTQLRAPFAGLIAEVSAEVGEWITPSPPAVPVPPVLDLLDPGSIYIAAPMDEVDSARIQPEQPARISVDSHPGRSFPGRVTRVAPYVLDTETQNRTVEIEAILDDETLASTLLPGTSADVEIILSVQDDVIRIPTAALIEGNKALLLAAGELQEVAVEPGLRNWDFVEIKSGLAAGDLLVTSLDRPEVKTGAQAEAVESLP